jgi:hypothetical protein
MQDDGGNLAMCQYNNGAEVSLWAYKNDKARNAAEAGAGTIIVGEPAWFATADDTIPININGVALALGGNVTKARPAPPPAPPSLVYKVVSDGGISSVNWTTADGQEQDTDVAGNTWSKNIADPDNVDIPVLSAQSAGGGNITCSIIRDGSVVVKQTSHGQYAVVTCSVG